MPTPNQHPFAANRAKATKPTAPIGYIKSTTGYETRSHQLVRPGAADHEKHPSRIGNTLVYRDGRRGVVA